jgi:hypothetical protein
MEWHGRSFASGTGKSSIETPQISVNTILRHDSIWISGTSALIEPGGHDVPADESGRLKSFDGRRQKGVLYCSMPPKTHREMARSRVEAKNLGKEHSRNEFH